MDRHTENDQCEKLAVLYLLSNLQRSQAVSLRQWSFALWRRE